MTPRMAHYTSHNPQSPSPGAVCQKRADLLDRLADVLASLSRAKLELTIAVEKQDQSLCYSAQLTIGELRSDFSLLRAELESHRAQHHC